jgi:N-acetylneuraminic acid mutarotase
MAYGISGSVNGDFELFIYDADSGNLIKRKTLSGVTTYSEYVSKNPKTVNIMAVPADSSKRAITYNGVALADGITYDSDTWLEIDIPANEPTPRRAFGVAEYEGKVYMVGGYTDERMDELWVWDSSNNAYTQLADLSEAKASSSCIAYNGKIYVFGGQVNSGYTNDFEVYDIATDSWSILSPTGTGPDARMRATVVEYDGKFYIYGGEAGSSFKNSLFEYNVSANSWTQKASGQERTAHCSAVWNGKMYSYGGYHDAGGYRFEMYEYNISTNSWTQKATASSSYGAHGASMVVYEGKLYIYGGANNSGVQKSMLEYNISGNSYTGKASGPYASLYTTGNTPEINGDMYIFQGYDGSSNNSGFIKYDIANNQYIVNPIESANRVSYSFHAMVGSKLYVISGQQPHVQTSGYNYFKKVLVYDASTRQWSRNKDVSFMTDTGTLTARYAGVTAEYDGKIYIWGGVNYLYGNVTNELVYYDEMWEYNPSTDVWTQKTSGGSDGAYKPCCGQYNGKIYITGGSQGATKYDETWEYDIINDTWAQKADHPVAMNSSAGAVYDGVFYTFGGWTNEAKSSCYKYTISTNTWSAIADLPINYARINATAVSANNGKIYVYGGSDGSDYVNTMLEYNTTNNTWSVVESGATDRSGAILDYYDGKIYMYGGQDESANRLYDIWEYYV